jgi:hypothetical protein
MNNLGKEHYGVVYKTTLPDGKIYIGQTTNLHWKSYYGSGIEMVKFLKANGTHGLVRENLRYCHSQKELDKWEMIYIKKFDSTNKNIGLNIQLGGSGRDKFASITKQKISISVSETMTIERRKIIASQHKGKTMSKEARKLISLATEGVNNPMYGIRGEDSPIFGRRFINNGKICKLIHLENEDEIPKGFVFGKIKK